MQERNERPARGLKAAVGVLVMGAVVAAPTIAVAAPSALERAAQKGAAAQAQANEEKARSDQQAQEEATKANDSLSFDPFAPKASVPAVATAAADAPKPERPNALELARRFRARQAALAQVAARRKAFGIYLAAIRIARRSPNTPPPSTETRASDPTQPAPNLAPGPE
jgi:hypothetical protein